MSYTGIWLRKNKEEKIAGQVCRLRATLFCMHKAEDTRHKMSYAGEQ